MNYIHSLDTSEISEFCLMILLRSSMRDHVELFVRIQHPGIVCGLQLKNRFPDKREVAEHERVLSFQRDLEFVFLDVRDVGAVRSP